MKKSIRNKILANASSAIVSIESADTDGITPPAPVEQQPTELPYTEDIDHEDETGITMEPVAIADLYEELEADIADVALDIKSIEQLALVARVGSCNLSNSAMEQYIKKSIGLESGTRILSATTTGGIKCTADIISVEEVATNAAFAGWDKVNRKINAIMTKAEGIAKLTDETARRIQDQFRAVKKAAFSYKGGATVNIGVMTGGETDLNKIIANTRIAIVEDLSGKISAQLDKAINELTMRAAEILSTKKGSITDIAANGVKTADSLANGYKIRDPEFKILGFTRQTPDDQLTLPEGIIRTLSGSERIYSYPRYIANKHSKRIEVELKPNTVKDLYGIGMNIGNEIAEQARIWPQRLSSLKAIADLAKSQARNVDVDRNTWAAEQAAATNAIKMWNANAAARRHYINVYNKMATEILEVLNHVTDKEDSPRAQVSRENHNPIYGDFVESFTRALSGKSSLEQNSTLPIHTADLHKLIKSTAFPGFKDNYVADILAYSDELKDHVACLQKAGSEIGRAFNESNINKYVDDVGRLADACYARYKTENPNETDWREIGNGVLELFTPEFIKSKLLTKHFNMASSGGSFITKFEYAPNLEIFNVTETRSYDSKRMLKRHVSGFNKDAALQFFAVFDGTNEISLPLGLDQCTFVREHPRFEDSLSMIALEPIVDVTGRLFEVMDETYFAIRDAIVTA